MAHLYPDGAVSGPTPRLPQFPGPCFFKCNDLTHVRLCHRLQYICSLSEILCGRRVDSRLMVQQGLGVVVERDYKVWVVSVVGA